MAHAVVRGKKKVIHAVTETITEPRDYKQLYTTFDYRPKTNLQQIPKIAKEVTKDPLFEQFFQRLIDSRLFIDMGKLNQTQPTWALRPNPCLDYQFLADTMKKVKVKEQLKLQLKQISVNSQSTPEFSWDLLGKTALVSGVSGTAFSFFSMITPPFTKILFNLAKHTIESIFKGDDDQEKEKKKEKSSRKNPVPGINFPGLPALPGGVVAVLVAWTLIQLTFMKDRKIPEPITDVLNTIFPKKTRTWNDFLMEYLDRSLKYLLKHPHYILILYFVFHHRSTLLKIITAPASEKGEVVKNITDGIQSFLNIITNLFNDMLKRMDTISTLNATTIKEYKIKDEKLVEELKSDTRTLKKELTQCKEDLHQTDKELARCEHNTQSLYRDYSNYYDYYGKCRDTSMMIQRENYKMIAEKMKTGTEVSLGSNSIQKIMDTNAHALAGPIEPKKVYETNYKVQKKKNLKNVKELDKVAFTFVDNENTKVITIGKDLTNPMLEGLNKIFGTDIL
uniref:Uncharacterized protein n=1 Tax=Mallomonas splendens TaxID=52552 RepID=A0A3G2R039_9STRA|nr:hypothetical protein [Mallomonas splendens]YP_009545465.1 hypothetical protein [Mallomonas splendens]AYO28595.1 hypothetical protein [Mallomonas splendens]AYO28619.1 hypothetical protein [Mallomonas splendens]